MDDSAAFSRGSSPMNTSSVLTGDTDDFFVGDRVWVNGNKPGYIQFIGETKFARGEWAGIVLDNYNGKNDGSINNVRYFQCEPNRGIFARLYRLSRFPLDRYGQRLPDSGIIKTTRSVTPDRGYRTTTHYSTNQPSYTLPARPANVITKVTTTTTALDNYNHNLKIGDRVVVHSRDLGMQTARVRYIGPTSFASGVWVGVELDLPNGKNDGSVSGKRYFTCPRNYGLFAPVNRVVKGDPTSSFTRTKLVNTTHERPWRTTRFQL